ncbi:substrate-binding periplasmic protein [Polynucleobacter victoriensis]|uniref:ABC-type amino acid transport substrate-binding protein n=1 Tax=Polynucleobacter victoriensis TaxID=2049319 RepID=A0A212TAE0_9BURK|nr:transporter substrate-binding domain-containing protein [Polynucleobacter victoriensis]SNC62992.1 ABC-type amino acid transport substrate-binding protein [Polynucleobacter victoriensis]
MNKKHLLHSLIAGIIGLTLSFTASADLASVKSKGILKVAVYNDFAPFSNGRTAPQGIDVDIAEALAKKLGVKLSLLPFDAGENLNDDLRNMVWKGHYLGYGPADVMLHVPIDPLLTNANKQVTFFAPYYRESVLLAIDTKRVPDFSNLKDLVGKKLCAAKGEAGANVFFVTDNGSLTKYVRIMNTAQECADLMIKGEVDVIAARRAELEASLSKLSSAQLVPVESPILPPKGWIVGMAIKADRPDLGEALAVALDQLRRSGELDDIFKKHSVKFVSP